MPTKRLTEGSTKRGVKKVPASQPNSWQYMSKAGKVDQGKKVGGPKKARVVGYRESTGEPVSKQTGYGQPLDKGKKAHLAKVQTRAKAAKSKAPTGGGSRTRKAT